MEINKSIKSKLFFLFIAMGAVPFTILIIVGAINMISQLEEAVKQNSLLRNMIISEHVTELVEKNLAVLHSLALNPEVIAYTQTREEVRRPFAEKMLLDTNAIFNDDNNLALTAGDAQQLFRTDGSTLVNVKHRPHYQEAMKGRDYVSDILSSMSTGKMIVVMEVPVRNAADEPIGMVQRNFDLTALQEFVAALDDSEISIIVMDRTGRVIANSDKIEGIGNEYAVDNRYKSVIDRVYNSMGTMHLDINDEECLVTYSRNLRTGWMIVTIRPYYYIMEQVYQKIFISLIIGTIMLGVISFAAWMLSMRVAKPIEDITDVVGKIAAGENAELPKVEVSRNDELGQMAAAFNKIRTEREQMVVDFDKVRTERDDFKLASELDKLTDLFNKTTMERICKMKLKSFNEAGAENIYMAFYIIDLDHFKEVNDLLGHQFGDKVLAAFANELRKVFRTNDCIGRFGGDEFVAVIDSLPNLDVVKRKAEQIKNKAYNLTVEGKSRFVTASIGIAIAPHDGQTYDELFKAADEAVYWVKNHGKNNYHCKFLDEPDA